MMKSVVYITRNDISWYSINANAYQKPLMLSEEFALTLFCPVGTTVPEEIANNCKVISVSCGDLKTGWSILKVSLFIWRTLKQIKVVLLPTNYPISFIATGFDFPCMFLGCWIKWKYLVTWVVFCWDPPALSWRDRNWRKYKVTIKANGERAQQEEWRGRNRVIIKGVDFLFRFLVRRADKVVFNVHPRLLDELKLDSKTFKTHFFPNGTNIHNQKMIRLRDSWCFGIIASAVPSKGFDLVWNAFLKLEKEIPQLRCVWIGEYNDDVRIGIEMQIREKGIRKDRFKLLGKMPHDEAMDQMSECGFAVYPYLFRANQFGYPLKVVEYMALGCGIVSARLPGVEPYIEEYKNGVLFKPGDIDDFVTKLKYVAGNEQIQQEWCICSLRKVENFTWSKINQEILKVL